MPRRKAAISRKGEVEVEAIRHQDRRSNIPTEELRDFLPEEERVILYPRDQSLDPQLVWKGKDEQDRKPLSVNVEPIFIQEKIHPQAIIKDVLSQAASLGKPTRQMQIELFGDFNGLPKDFGDRVDFYKHDQNWSNRLILGDSLLVMTSLSEKEGLKGKVQMIYFDPPYGIKFGSNWQVSTRKREVKNGKDEDTSREPEQVRAFRDTWEMGIHSYLSYLRDRFSVSRELLTDSGSLFIQIGNENVHLVRSLLDEVFGPENFIAQIIFYKTGYQTSKFLPANGDYVLWYAKNQDVVKLRRLWIKDGGWVAKAADQWIELPNGQRSRAKNGAMNAEASCRLFSHRSLESTTGSGASRFVVHMLGKEYSPKRGWSTDPKGFARLMSANRIEQIGAGLRFVSYSTDFPFSGISSVWDDTGAGSFLDPNIYVVQTVTKVIDRCMLMATDPGDLVLDPTCGSGTTAYCAEQWGRRWITIDTSRVALALARTRIMSARYPYYILQDSEEGAAKLREMGKPSMVDRSRRDVRKGFVYEQVPHITLKSIANNENIDRIGERWKPEITEALEGVSASLGKNVEEWEVPREGETPEEAKKAVRRFWEIKKKCQKEIDASIGTRAEDETLYDCPYEDKKRVRVSGPFTVEAFSPHRSLPSAKDEALHAPSIEGGHDFVTTILQNLRASGVQNTRLKEHMVFENLEPFPGEWINAAGSYLERDGVEKRVAVFIGPEFGTVSPDHLKKAAMEAMKGIGFDVLLVCGFAFDAMVSEDAKTYGKLTVLPVKMNPDLSMGGDLLKKTKGSNLFMIFGEPDISIVKSDDGVIVEIRGLDIYDPTTGSVRSSSTDDIACWFVDTDYDGESFFVRHAYFTGADRPYDKLKRTLRAEVDESAWETIYSTKSRPFPVPISGKIAVKVINHFGDEVVSVHDVV